MIFLITIVYREQGWSLETDKTTVVDVSTVLLLDDIIPKLVLKKIIYVGEVHDQYAHHLEQLKIIKALYKTNIKIAIAMEMFERINQPNIDNYISGKTNEKRFLRSSRYFMTWGFDYHLYRDIIEFAKTNNIPVIALNIERSIVKKVSRTGLESLTDEERSIIPNDIDLTDQEYNKRLKELFNNHPAKDVEKFDFFFESQILWDEYMAETIADYLENNTDRQIVVITGNGHLSYGSGIPNRVKRRHDVDYAILLNEESPQKGIADYILFPKAVNTTKSPKLMAMLVETDGRVKVDNLPKDSISKAAGLKKGDYILSLDNSEIKSIEDIQVFLFFCNHGDTIKIRLLRNNHNKDILLSLK